MKFSETALYDFQALLAYEPTLDRFIHVQKPQPRSAKYFVSLGVRHYVEPRGNTKVRLTTRQGDFKIVRAGTKNVRVTPEAAYRNRETRKERSFLVPLANLQLFAGIHELWPCNRLYSFTELNQATILAVNSTLMEADWLSSFPFDLGRTYTNYRGLGNSHGYQVWGLAARRPVLTAEVPTQEPLHFNIVASTYTYHADGEKGEERRQLAILKRAFESISDRELEKLKTVF